MANGSLTESYVIVNQQAENLSQLPERKIEVLGNLFRALPSDDAANPKELIRELIRAGKNLAKVEHFGNKGVRKTYGYGKRTSKLKLARMAEKEACENGLYATFSGCNVSLCYIREKTQHRANKREWLLASIDDYMESRRLDEGERFKANRKR